MSDLFLITKETLPAGPFSKKRQALWSWRCASVYRPDPRFDPPCFKTRRKKLCKMAVAPGKKEAQLDTQAG